MRLNNITYAGTCLFLCDVAVMRFIPPPNSSSSFEVSAIFWDGDLDDICLNTTYLWHCF